MEQPFRNELQYWRAVKALHLRHPVLWRAPMKLFQLTRYLGAKGPGQGCDKMRKDPNFLLPNFSQVFSLTLAHAQYRVGRYVISAGEGASHGYAKFPVAQ